MEDEFASFDGDHAVNINAEQFTKYRAVEVLGGLNLHSALPLPPSNKTSFKACSEERYFSVSVPEKAKDSAPAPSSSSCPEKPFHICPKDSLCIKGLTFAEIKATVERVLSGLLDYDWSFIPVDNSWKCKYFKGSNVREVSIKCFWDAPSEKYVMEVKRIRGDGILSCQTNTSDILDQLRAAFSSSAEGEERDGPARPMVKRTGGKLRGALPLPSSLKAVPSKEQFLQGVEPILKMAGSPNFESRLEAARMLCDLAEKAEKSLLQLPACQDLCFQILDLLLHDNEDQSEEIKQFALMAFGLLAEHDVYQECFLHFKDFDEMIRMIDNPPSASANSTQSSCDCIQMRRQAAKGMAKLAKKAASCGSFQSAKASLCKQFQSYGHLDETNWRQHCQGLKDERLKTFALEIVSCFQ